MSAGTAKLTRPVGVDERREVHRRLGQQPDRRVVVGLTFPDERPGNRRYRLLVEHGDAEVCAADPGGVPDVEIVARSTAFVDWHRGALRWADAVRSGGIRIEGPRAVIRSLPFWNRHEPVVEGAGPR